LESLSSLLSNPTNGAPFGLPIKSYGWFTEAPQKLRSHTRTSKDSMNTEPVGLPPPQVVACAHSLLGELFPSINITYVLLQNMGFA